MDQLYIWQEGQKKKVYILKYICTDNNGSHKIYQLKHILQAWMWWWSDFPLKELYHTSKSCIYRYMH